VDVAQTVVRLITAEPDWADRVLKNSLRRANIPQREERGDGEVADGKNLGVHDDGFGQGNLHHPAIEAEEIAGPEAERPERIESSFSGSQRKFPSCPAVPQQRRRTKQGATVGSLEGGGQVHVRQFRGKGILDFNPGERKGLSVYHLQAQFGSVPGEKAGFPDGALAGDPDEGEAGPGFCQERPRQNQPERDDQRDEAFPS
jgi:hypothetical protein